MARGWNCSRCSTLNDETGVVCTGCGLMRGSVAMPATVDPQPTAVALDAAAPGAVDAGEPSPQPSANEPAIPPAPAPAGTTSAMDDWTPRDSADAASPAAKVPLWRRLPIGLLVFGVLVVGGGASSWFLGADRGETGEIAKPGDLTAVDLRVGDCFDFKDPEAEVFDDVTARPCAQEHEFELFFTGPMAQGAYPDDAAFDAFVLANCDPAFETYVGTVFQESALDVTWISPNEDAWNQGDRSIQCAVSDPAAQRRMGSLKASKR